MLPRYYIRHLVSWRFNIINHIMEHQATQKGSIFFRYLVMRVFYSRKYTYHINVITLATLYWHTVMTLTHSHDVDTQSWRIAITIHFFNVFSKNSEEIVKKFLKEWFRLGCLYSDMWLFQICIYSCRILLTQMSSVWQY